MLRKKQKTLPESTDIRVLVINKRKFVVGLAWETIKAQRNVIKEVKRVGKSKNLDVVAIRKSDSIQAGFAPKTNQKLRGCYSLIVSMASLLEGCCIAVIPVGHNSAGVSEFTIVGRTEKGGIHPFSDEIYLEDEIDQIVTDLRSALRGNNTKLEIKIYGDIDRFIWATDALELDALLNPKELKKEFKLRPLTWGMTRQQLVMAALLALIVLGALVIWQQHEAQEEKLRKIKIALQLKAQEELNRKARYQTALDKLRHPWANQPSVADLITDCEDINRRLPLSIKGWVPTVVNCTSDHANVSYARLTGSAVRLDEFVKEVQSMFGVLVDFNFQDTSITSFTLPIKMTPYGDDPMQDLSSQLLKMISVFQSYNVNSTFKDVEIKEIKENNLNEALPRQDWKEFQFDISTNIPPRDIFKGDEFKGVRLNSIDYILNGGGGVKYNIKGSLYGRR